MIETADGITTPSGDDDYALVQDLAAMATTIQAALERRANTRRGSQTERLAQTPNLPDGTVWKDTTGDRVLWVKDQGQWERIWPEPDRRVLRIGSYEVKLGFPFLNLRWLQDDGTTRYITLQQNSSDPVNLGAMLTAGTNGNLDTATYFRRNGEIGVNAGGQTRTLPWASAGGKTSITPAGPNQITSVPVTFPAGYFTQNPVVQLTAESGYPANIGLSVTNVSTSGCTINMYRTDSAIATIHWTATQYREGSF